MTVKQRQQHTTGSGKRPHYEAEQGNPIEGKDSQEKAKESEICSHPQLGR